MVGVYGPRQSDRREAYREHGKINCDAKFTSFAGRQRGRFAQSPEERELSASILTALEGVVILENFPKAVLDVYCTVLEAGGSEGAVAVMAAALAVADAGVEMKDVVSACSVSKVQGALLLDPTSEESYREEAGLMLAVAGTGGEVTQLVARGRWEDETFKEALELCLGGCTQLDTAAREALREGARGEASHKQTHRYLHRQGGA
jgi:exosome complex component MTR3